MQQRATAERIYIIDAGLARVDDASIYSPGINVGVPMTLSCNAYLIRHPSGWLLWDTGTQDDLIADPEGRIIAHGIRGTLRRTFASRAAMSRFRVPLTLDSCELRGSLTERGTEARAPWWRM